MEGSMPNRKINTKDRYVAQMLRRRRRRFRQQPSSAQGVQTKSHKKSESLYEQFRRKYPKIGGLPRIPDNPTPAQYKVFARMYKNSVWYVGGCRSCA